ncbi:extracellular solute-binding protein [Streptomyces durbertensis]|uniref:Extracellular solute-binding protein n=1 Tax=Streptomyces durbertensis TaxID=2448886 RepID=A0ABR6ECD3_9ACTN|nr:extracellular solute-binding protein [Streptomyces durbertensis]MBB1242988.1 extracellular solute-binding protein [Streptomyces durbertensis]
MRRGITGTLALALSVCLGVAATGCGAGDAENPAEAASRVSGTVTWWDTSGESESPLFRKLVAAFEKDHPKIKVDYTQVDFFEAQERYVKAQKAGSGVPDVLRADVGWTAGFVGKGYLADLTDSPALGDAADFLETTTASVTHEDRVYGIPQVTDPLALLYNRALFEKAGIGRPPSTWKELKDAAAKIKDATGADGLALNTDGYFSLPFLYGEETDLVDPGRSAITVAGAAAVRGAETAADLVTSGAARKPPAEDAYGAMQTAFKSGEVAMIINGPWATADVFSGSAFRKRENLGIAPLPAGSTGTAGSPTGGHNLVISKNTEHREAAEVFVGYMTAAAQQERAALELGLLPTRKSAYSRAVLSDPVRNSFYFAHTKAVPRITLPQSAELFATYQPHWTAILRGEETPREGMRATAEEWRGTLLPGYRLDG